MVLSITACGKKDAKTDSTAAAGDRSYTEQLAIDQQTYAQYVTLGKYKGLEVTVDRSSLTVTDADVQKYISDILSENGKSTPVTTGVTASGDSIVLDYSGYLNGVAFSGGTATDASYTVGSGQFISDLDKGLVGLEVGKQYDIPCKFPTDYSSANLAGKDVIFKVTVTAINKTTPAEFTDEFVKSIASEYSSTATTTAEFTEYVKNYLKDQASSKFDNSKYSLIWDQIAASSTVSDYPADEISSLADTVVNNVKSEFNSYGSYYGISTFEAYLSSAYGYDSVDAFREYAKEYAKTYLKEKMVLTMIAKAENISITEDQIKAKGEEIAKYYGYESFQAVIDTFGSAINNEVGYAVLSETVSDFLITNSVEK